MASVLKVDKLDPQSGTALEIGTSGDTVSIPSGATLDISASTLTPPATMPASSGINFTALNATNLGSGTVPTARLGTGTASSSVFLAGDSTWIAAGGDNTPAFSVYRSSAQACASGASTKIQFNAEIFDTDSAFDSSTNYRFTVPVGSAGNYFFSSHVRATAWTSTGARLISSLNGVTKIHSAITNSATADGGYHTVESTWAMTLAESDYVEMLYWHDNGSTQDIQGDSGDWGLTIFAGFKLIA